MIQEVFGNNVKQFRIQRGMSQDILAVKCEIDRPQISKIEQGKVNVTLDTIQRISDALKVDIRQLFSPKIDLHPFVKWAGGKTQLLEKLKKLMPSEYDCYFEPFVGSGALFLNVHPEKAVINDSNTELMCAYDCFKDDYLFEQLKAELKEHEEHHSEEYYYEIRSMDKDENFLSLPIYIRAARLIYLNKACFNGLYRVNSKGYFNVPSGKKAKVKTFDENNFVALHNFFKNKKIVNLCVDFDEAVKSAKQGDFVYFDPPYDTPENKNSFTSYSKDSFGKEEQIRLAEVYKKLSNKGVLVMLSNHNTSFIRELYKDFNIHVVSAKRMINSDASGRGLIEEVIITNY